MVLPSYIAVTAMADEMSLAAGTDGSFQFSGGTMSMKLIMGWRVEVFTPYGEFKYLTRQKPEPDRDWFTIHMDDSGAVCIANKDIRHYTVQPVYEGAELRQ